MPCEDTQSGIFHTQLSFLYTGEIGNARNASLRSNENSLPSISEGKEELIRMGSRCSSVTFTEGNCECSDLKYLIRYAINRT